MIVSIISVRIPTVGSWPLKMDIHTEECPVCHYIKTLPYEHRCPICVTPDPNLQLPINAEKLLSLHPVEGAAPKKPAQRRSKK